MIDINDPCYSNYLNVIGNAIVNSKEKTKRLSIKKFQDIDQNKIDIKYNRNELHYTNNKNTANQEIDFSKFEILIDFGTSLTQKDIFGRNPLFIYL